jgi:methyl-accepting chemotaxis protein
MTDEELRTLVASLAISTANNSAEARANAEAIRELRTTVETQGRVMLEGFATLRDSTDSQARNIEMMRESISYNTETVASSLELAAEALKLSANTSRNLDRLENDIADLKQIVGIVIRDNQADRGRITRLEEQTDA